MLPDLSLEIDLLCCTTMKDNRWNVLPETIVFDMGEIGVDPLRQIRGHRRGYLTDRPDFTAAPTRRSLAELGSDLGVK